MTQLTTQPRLDASLDAIKKLVLDSLVSPCSKLAYDTSLTQFLDWHRLEWHNPLNRACVQAFKSKLLDSGLAPATVNLRLAAVKKLASEACDNNLLDPSIAAGIARIRGVKRLGVRTGNWLTLAQAKRLLDVPDRNTLVGKRDRALLAVLLGAGLRREETAALTFDCIQLRDNRWCLTDIHGKGGRIRTVPIGGWVKAVIDEWSTAAGISTGIVFRRAYSTGNSIANEKPLTAQCIFRAVRRHAESLGLNAAPHDLRRTFAKLARRGKSPIEQIKASLGHGSVLTTERYLGSEQNIQDSPADRLGLGPSRRNK